MSSPLTYDEDKDIFDSEVNGDDMSMCELFNIETYDKYGLYDTDAENELRTVTDISDSNSNELFVGVDSSSVCRHDNINEYSDFLQEDLLMSSKDENLHVVSSSKQHENVSSNTDVLEECDVLFNSSLLGFESSEMNSDNWHRHSTVAQTQEYSKENIPDLSNIPENALKETTDGFINVYSCSACDEGFLSFAELTAHMKYHIPGAEKPKHACTVCARKFFTAGALEHHVRMHSCQPEKCEICQKIYKNKYMLALHKLTHSTTKIHPCQYCNRKFVFASSLEQHLIADHISELQFLCKDCNKVFHSELELITHRKSHSKLSFKQKVKCLEYLCYICGDVFDNFRKLKSHEQQFHESSEKQQKSDFKNPSKYICEVCGKIFKYLALLNNHAVVHQETKEQFMCEICGVVWKNRWLLQKHQISHSSHQEHVCRTCHTAYKTSSALATHERNCHGTVYTELGLENTSLTFLCEFCSKEFSTRERLEIHVRNHTGEHPFQCKKCDKSYISQHSLHLHQLISHRVYKKQIKCAFICHICGKTFTSKNSLNMHLNIHTGKRPFKCKICSKAFTQKGGLVQHILYHTDMRSYVCTLCGKAFLRNSHLKIHIQTHTGEKPHKCDICGHAFSQLGDMKKHRRKLHSVS
ncbi:endothelial zinc finger protein induced by tumor necrosis factor alpha-like [Cryptotermes secundus]|uniref:endothelial zinc finger protein induced by tumor necrosis factor alpha-like n=1 Tax=Cryptotermes secundus TaxID=105785 RepID=UPI000CD7CB34|nr:endothelial zinc finger protein induced by tumor necrosis factor alpha-like [Cryptotermes secundus]